VNRHATGFINIREGVHLSGNKSEDLPLFTNASGVRRIIQMQMKLKFFFSFFVITCTVSCLAESKLDSIHHIREVVVTSKPTFREVIPTQKLNGQELERLNSYSVADAMRYFSGLQIKDYGGVGGIKTVNIRSMGTNHLGVYYDGIELGNAQNGQIDLGQFSLDNIEEITLYNGQKSQIFQPASDFGNAGSVYIRTRVPHFDTGKYYNMKATVKFASSDVIRTSLLYETRLSSVLSSSFSAEWLNASGKYKFRYRRVTQTGEVAYDTTATRQNGDINATRMEANLHGVINRGAWYLKGYTYNSERGIPGAIVNNVWRRGERQWDTNSFLQGHLQKDFGGRFSTQWMAKYAFYRTHYVNNDTTQVSVDNLYKQQEFYVSTSNVYEIMPNWSASVSYDFKWNRMKSDMTNFVFPTRYSNLVSAATAIDYKHLKMQASILATFVKDHLEKQADPSSQHVLSPAIFANLFPFGTKIFSLRAYVKKSFRMPTFNDLYYADMGNSKLNPETAVQYDFGFTFNKYFSHGMIREISLQSDGYYNTVHNKIIAYPKGQQFRWTMLNLGRVHITGLDVTAAATMMPVNDLFITTRLQYTYQKAIDVTDPSDTYYHSQIPYIPWNSGSAIVNVTYRSWNLNYSFIYVGKRYNQQENIVYNYMQPWYTSDLSVMKEFTISGIHCKATLEVNNLFSQDYDVILNYPMPKQNYALSFSVEI
jgi:vitamin B12 transporter